MARHEGLLHQKLPPDARVNVRDTGMLIGTEDVEQFSSSFFAENLIRIREALREVARQAENRGYLVDEYNTASLTGGPGTTSQLTIPPTYEYMPEQIQAILISGPPAGTASIILGDRQWPIVMPAAGILPVGPLRLLLNRNDLRQLTASTPGTWSLELMGIADQRFQT
jgi:hypothetical protein